MKNISAGLHQFNAFKYYNNLIILGGFNVDPDETNMSDFLNVYNLKNFVKEKHVIKILRILHVLAW